MHDDLDTRNPGEEALNKAEKGREIRHQNQKKRNKKRYAIKFREQYKKTFLAKLEEREEELYKYLDSAKFDNGETTADKLAGMFDMHSTEIISRKLEHKTSPQNAEKIKQKGFDPKTINITNFGPGFYFNGEEFYSGITLTADYEGRTVKGKKMGEYDSINSEIGSLLKKHLQLPLGFNNHYDMMMRMGESEAVQKFIHQYSRHVIADTLKIDAAVAENMGRYFVVFNPKAINNVRY